MDSYENGRQRSLLEPGRRPRPIPRPVGEDGSGALFGLAKATAAITLVPADSRRA
jgi:hypothetical protein